MQMKVLGDEEGQGAESSSAPQSLRIMAEHGTK